MRGAAPRLLLAAVLAQGFPAQPARAQAYDGPAPALPTEPAALYRLPGQWPPGSAPEPEMEVLYEPFVPEVFFPSDRAPEFPGGPEALQRFLRQQLRYPAGAGQGQVLVQFVVEDDGRISGAQVVRRLHPLLDAEVLRVVRAMPPWRPGHRNGRPERVGYTLPVTFRLPTDAPAPVATPAAGRR